ncbi:MAG: hypothetical protein NTY00_07220 [Deltaproteobacteria bacterium]|nr:hypothetical protein [Deltaproteobacteria bacterium]
MNHKIFLSDLFTSLPEINGAFIFSSRSGIVAKQLDQETSGFNPLAIGKKIAGIAAIASEQLSDITQIEVNFDTMILSGRLLPDQNWLFLLHTPELSSSMIRMTLQMALNNSNQESDDTQANQAESPAEDMDEDVITFQKGHQVDMEVLMSPGAPLAKPLNILQDELANCIGPAALPVFQDIVNRWCQEHTPALDTLKHLIPLIDKEIDDTKDIKAFHANIKNLFPQE